jgi:hypothetical protein
MNLEDELRAVLSQEAEMRTTPTPDIEGMVNGGETRLRRRNSMRLGLAAAAVLLVGGGIYGATQLGGDGSPDTIANQPSEPADAAAPPTWADTDSRIADPGTYRTHVGLTDAGEVIEADFTIDGTNWEASNHPVATVDQDYAGIGVYRPDAVAGGCRMQAGHQPAAAGQQQLAAQLAAMPGATVVERPTRTEAFGHSAIHAAVKVDAFCDGATEGNAYAVADDRGISYIDEAPASGSKTVRVDFWVVDVDGTNVVVDMFHTESAPEDLVAQADRARESIAFVDAE